MRGFYNELKCNGAVVWPDDHATGKMESRAGLHTLEHADTIGLGSRDYTLVCTDNEKE